MYLTPESFRGDSLGPKESQECNFGSQCLVQAARPDLLDFALDVTYKVEIKNIIMTSKMALIFVFFAYKVDLYAILCNFVKNLK